LTNSLVWRNVRGIYNSGTATLTNSTVSENAADSEGGGIRNAGTLTLTNSTVSGNIGGGIYGIFGTLTVSNSTVSGNTAPYGGGIFNDGTLTLTNSTVSGNTADLGGGIDNEYGTATLTNSTVSGNSAVTGDGGGIYNGATLTLTNSTVSGNTAGDYGGGIANGATLTLTNSTVSGNTANRGGGGILNNAFGSLTLNNTVVDNDCDGTIMSDGGNLESPADTCGFDQPTDQVNVTVEQLNLGPLADNGGPTWTHALLPGSVAIDQIPEAECLDADGEPLTTDQRGAPRPVGTMCDVGALELEQ
jgi:Right handed beta helix region